jgi:hypothetical protein
VAAECAAEFAWVTDFAARNYAGFETKTAGDERSRYDALLGELSPLAAAVSDPAECGAVLARWLAFFDDGHLSIGRRSAGASAAPDAPPGDDEIRARFADWPTRPLSEQQARSRLDALGASRHPIEGIWESADGSYRGVVLRDESARRTILHEHPACGFRVVAARPDQGRIRVGAGRRQLRRAVLHARPFRAGVAGSCHEQRPGHGAGLDVVPSVAPGRRTT